MQVFAVTLLLLLPNTGFAEQAEDLPRKLDKKQTDLKNGATLLVDLKAPNHNESNSFQINFPIKVNGKASIGIEDPDVSYIYILDTSGSTDDDDGPCGTVLQCMQEFFVKLHAQALSGGAAELAAVINFDDSAVVDVSLQDPNSGINNAFRSGVSSGGTNCTSALLAAAALVTSDSNTASHTHVIFAGDGECNDGYENKTLWDAATQEAADTLGATGAIVHTVAVGVAVDCSPTNADGDKNHLPAVARNGGDCVSARDTNDLPELVDKIIGASLENIEMKLDDGNYTQFAGKNLTHKLPHKGPIELSFKASVIFSEQGEHTICVRVTGSDVIDGFDRVEDCHQIMVNLKVWKSWYTLMAIIASVFVVGMLIYAAVAAKRSRTRAYGAQNDLQFKETTASVI